MVTNRKQQTLSFLSYFYFLMYSILSFSSPTKAFSFFTRNRFLKGSSFVSSTSSLRVSASTTAIENNNSTLDTTVPSSTNRRRQEENVLQPSPPWSNTDLLTNKRKQNKRNNVVRVRQHVNPLARRFQQPTILSEEWPRDVFTQFWNTNDNEETTSSPTVKPLLLDIGCSKGGFLLHLAAERPNDYNYLGLEIRPLAVQFAQERLHNSNKYKHICPGHLDFVGCNANVDLERLLTMYRKTVKATQLEETKSVSQAQHSTSSSVITPLQMVCLQFPDPHFKKSHAKRRVVTTELVQTLPQFMPPGSKIFLQSDVQSVLDDMRERFREDAPLHFQDQINDIGEYYPENIIGIPTEREISVLEKDLPVYRAVFVRTDVPP